MSGGPGPETEEVARGRWRKETDPFHEGEGMVPDLGAHTFGARMLFSGNFRGQAHRDGGGQASPRRDLTGM